MTRVVLYGRTNVGKSTLFNYLVGRSQAIVHDEKGVTRDCLHAKVLKDTKEFVLVDTPGYFHDIRVSEHPDLDDGITEGIDAQLAKADVILFVLDALQGVTALDESLSKNLRKLDKSVIVIVNKAEKKEQHLDDFFRLGFPTVIPISAKYKSGKVEMLDALDPFLNPAKKTDEDADTEVDETLENQEDDTIRIAIFGRPNVGKSTLLNAFLGYNAQLVADMPGVTRDSVVYTWDYHGKAFELVDTPGIRKAQKKADELEKKAVDNAYTAMKFAHVAVFVVDATQDIAHGVDKQELSLLSDIIEEGRVIVIALNKADELSDPDVVKKTWETYFEVNLAQIKGISFVLISAKNRRGLDNLLRVVEERTESWRRRIPTSKLNDWLSYCVEKTPPPLVKGRRVKLKYMVQLRSKPPSFRIVSNFSDEVPENYRRFLLNRLQQDLGLKGIPVRLYFRASSRNPYVKRKKR